MFTSILSTNLFIWLLITNGYLEVVGQYTPTAVNTALTLPEGFSATIIGNVPGARGLASLPNGDLLIGTGGTEIKIISNAENGEGENVGSVATFAVFPEQDPFPSPWPTNNGPQSVAFGKKHVYASTEKAIWRMSYNRGQQTAAPTQIASVRTGPVAPTSDGDVHLSTSVTVAGNKVYAAVGSSCDACVEVDPTRATIQMMELDGSNMQLRARRWRNPIAFAVDPETDTVWAGGAAQDSLPEGHPFEYMDPVSLRSLPADYGWPECEENHVPYTPSANCDNVVIPALIFPAYATIIGSAFYPTDTKDMDYAFPKQWEGGLFVGIHGSWHVNASNIPWVPPQVAFVPFQKNTRMPKVDVDWSNPYSQWREFFGGFQDAEGIRIGQCTGVAIGSEGSLFVADDSMGNIYRIRPIHHHK